MACTVVIGALAGCGWSQGRFSERLADATCEWTVACYPDLYDGLDECLAELQEDPDEDSDCDFDRRLARKCVRAIEDLECPGPGTVPEFPEACRDVYDCPIEDTGG